MLKILKSFWLASLRSEMEYRANFITSGLYAFGQLAGTLFTVNVLYDKGYHFAGWSREASYLVVGLFTLMDGVTSSVLNPNLSRIIVHVQRGTLDFVLLKPIDSQFHVSTRNVTPWGLPNIVFSLCLIIYAGTRLGLTLDRYILGILPVLLALVILYCLWFAVATTTIWFTKMWNATEVLRSFIEAGKYPLSAYNPAFQFFLVFILPVAFLTTIPAEIMRGTQSSWFILIELAIAIVLLVVTRLFWKFALRHYTSASS